MGNSRPGPNPGVCQRNGRALEAGIAESWTVGKNMAKTSNMSSEALVSALAAAHPQILRHDLDSWVEAVQLVGHPQVQVNLDLSALVRQCQESENTSLRSQFFSMLGRIQLAFRCRRQVLRCLLLILSHRQVAVACTRQRTYPH